MKELERKVLKKGLLFDFVRGQYMDEFKVTREFIETNYSAVVVLPITDDKKVVLVRQFRAPTGYNILEVPAGKIEPGEEPSIAASRELTEETGMIADQITFLGKGYASPGISSELYHFYLATGISIGKQNPDPDEKVVPVSMDMIDFVSKLGTEEIIDSKTIAVYGLWRAIIGNKTGSKENV
jgi:ADP-ribose pyrophosphatase